MPIRNASFNLFQRDNGRWYASIYDPDRHPQKIQRTLRTTDKGIARKKLVDWERAYADGDFDPWTEKQKQALTVQQAVEDYRVHRRNPGDADASIRTRVPPHSRTRSAAGIDLSKYLAVFFSNHPFCHATLPITSPHLPRYLSVIVGASLRV